MLTPYGRPPGGVQKERGMQPILKQILEARSPPETKKQMAHRDLKFQN